MERYGRFFWYEYYFFERKLQICGFGIAADKDPCWLAAIDLAAKQIDFSMGSPDSKYGRYQVTTIEITG